MTNYDRFLREKYQATAAVVPDLAPVLDEHLESDRSHLHSYHVSLWIPMMQSIITALLFALDVLIVAYVIKNKLFGEYWSWAVMTFFVILTVSWLLLLERWLNLTIPLERFLKRDLNHDGFIGQALAPAREVRVEIKDGNQTAFVNLPDTPQAHQLYRGLVNGMPTGIRNWCGRDKPLSDGVYKEIRDALIVRNLAYWIGKPGDRVGWELTRKGLIALSAIIGEQKTTTPPPQADDVL